MHSSHLTQDYDPCDFDPGDFDPSFSSNTKCHNCYASYQLLFSLKSHDWLLWLPPVTSFFPLFHPRGDSSHSVGQCSHLSCWNKLCPHLEPPETLHWQTHPHLETHERGSQTSGEVMWLKPPTMSGRWMWTGLSPSECSMYKADWWNPDQLSVVMPSMLWSTVCCPIELFNMHRIWSKAHLQLHW